MAAPGPMNRSHQPGLGLAGVLWAWLEADRPVCSRIALDLSAFNVPQVSYATSKPGRTPPQSRRSGSRDRKTRWRPVVYDGSGPDDEDTGRADSWALFASRASRQGKERAGFDESGRGNGGCGCCSECTVAGVCIHRLETLWNGRSFLAPRYGLGCLLAGSSTLEDFDEPIGALRESESRLRLRAMARKSMFETEDDQRSARTRPRGSHLPELAILFTRRVDLSHRYS